MNFCSVCFFITTEPYKDDNEHKLLGITRSKLDFD